MRDDVKHIIEEVVRDRLNGASVERVLVSEDEDSEGDRIFRVMVVFDSSKGKLDSHRTIGLARHLRAKLEDRGAFLHPVFRFVSSADAKKVIPEAA